jgi:hypothetical protein
MHKDTARSLRDLAAGSPPVSITLGPAERLVGLGFRCWLSGFRTGDIGCWEIAWNAYAAALGDGRAQAATRELAQWVRTVHVSAQRRIELSQPRSPDFCRDERLAISMVAASQHSSCPAIRACAVALLDTVTVDDVVDGARGFARSLKQADLILPAATFLEGWMPVAHNRPSNWH